MSTLCEEELGMSLDVSKPGMGAIMLGLQNSLTASLGPVKVGMDVIKAGREVITISNPTVKLQKAAEVATTKLNELIEKAPKPPLASYAMNLFISPLTANLPTDYIVTPNMSNFPSSININFAVKVNNELVQLPKLGEFVVKILMIPISLFFAPGGFIPTLLTGIPKIATLDFSVITYVPTFVPTLPAKIQEAIAQVPATPHVISKLPECVLGILQQPFA